MVKFYKGLSWILAIVLFFISQSPYFATAQAAQENEEVPVEQELLINQEQQVNHEPEPETVSTEDMVANLDPLAESKSLTSRQTTSTWETIVFGQSTDGFFNNTGLQVDDLYKYDQDPDGGNGRFNVQLNENGTLKWFENNYVRDLNGVDITKGPLVDTFQMESRAGKVTSAHDGITFYYTKIPTTQNFKLSGDIEINHWGLLQTQVGNSQIAAGLMVRDILGSERQNPPQTGYEEITSASNIATARIVAPSTNDSTKFSVNLFERNGVTNQIGNRGSAINTVKGSKEDISIADKITLTLERTDDNFKISYAVNGNHVEMMESKWGSDIVTRMDKDNMYVGFYVARNSWINVSNTSFEITDANTVATSPLEVERDNPDIIQLSSDIASSDNYSYFARTNYDGKVTLKMDGSIVVSDLEVKAYSNFIYPTKLLNNTTQFELTFTPGSDAPNQTHLTKTVTVTKNKQMADPKEIFVVVDGKKDAPGTISEPTDLETALRYVAPGGQVYMRGGDYGEVRLQLPAMNSGLPDESKRLLSYENEVVKFTGYSSGLQLNAYYWHISGFEIDKGNVRVNGSYNTLERLKVHSHNETGFQIGNGNGSNPLGWPAYNLILNCESYNNMDAAKTNADGFAAKLGVGPGNIFQGCISFHNIDDGWDLFNKIEDGANEPVTIENCISYGNGRVLNGEVSGAGNGFKLGGEGMPVAHKITNSIAFGNHMDGFTDNFNPGKLELTNNTSFNNNRFNYIFRANVLHQAVEQGTFVNNISVRTDKEHVPSDYITGNISVENIFFQLNDTSQITGVTTTEFINASYTENVEQPILYPRDHAGNIIYGDFLRPLSTSMLLSSGAGGVYPEYLGALSVPKDPYTYGEAEISKQEVGGSDELAGATLNIKSATGDTFDYTWETTSEPKVLAMDEGFYILTEIEPNDGYRLNTEPIEFEVKDGEMTKITIYNEFERTDPDEPKPESVNTDGDANPKTTGTPKTADDFIPNWYFLFALVLSVFTIMILYKKGAEPRC